MEKHSNKELYIAASAYLFDLGYLLAWLTQMESTFIKFHLEQARKLVKFILLLGFILIVISLLWENVIAKYLLYVGALVIVIYLILSFLGAVSALRGKTNKLL